MVAADPSAPRFGGLTGRPLSICVTVVATCGFLLFGYDQGIMSGIITASVFNNVFPPTLDDSTMQGFVTAIYEIGCLVGAIFILYVGDRLGRRRAIILGAAIMCLGVLIQVTAFKDKQAFAQFTIGRIITGIGNGINTSTIPTYQAECSRNTNRGLLICIEGGTIAFGTLISYWIDFGASYAFTGPDDLKAWAEDNHMKPSDIDVYSPPFGLEWGHNLDITWRFPIAFQIVFGLFICIGMTFLPESPRWLMSRERYEEGELVLAALAGKSVNDPQVQLQKTVVIDSIRASGGGGKSTPMSAVFSNGKTQHFRRALLGMSSQFMQQIGGCNAVIYYLPILVKESLGRKQRFSMLGGDWKKLWLF
ncbi:Prostaglandin E synthase 3 (Cytosolic) [Ascosphaera pollenicola]|nr:Prostaglandin E synthase 3 (Cytosolic) [Ascosphaera pollenicola]